IEVQPVLLRALESGEIEPLGATIPSRVKVRVIAATNRKLDEAMRTGRFREDLFYRLAVVQLHVPPLRERSEDIPIIARHFAQTLGITELPGDILDEWKEQAWPGNARELKNAVLAFAAL